MKKFFFAAIAASSLLASCDMPGTPKVTLKTEADSLSYALGMANGATDEQIKMYLMQTLGDSTYVEEFFKGVKEGLNASDDKKDMARQLGIQTGMQMKTRMFPNVEAQVFAGDSTAHISTRNFFLGMSDVRKGKSAIEGINQENVEGLLKNLFDSMSAKANEKLYGEKKKASEEFIANAAKQDGMKTLDGGVCYKVITEGKGEVPTMSQTVSVEYEGRLMDGTVFDASHGQPVEFPCNGVVPGFATALTNMPVGSEWEVYIPWNLAYGAQGSGPIPPYSALVFKIKLVKIAE